MKVFWDTNIWLRLFIDTGSPQNLSAKKLISQAEQGIYMSYTSAIVLLEVQHVLRTFYKMTESNIHEYIEAILAINSLTVIDQTDFKSAWKLHKKSGNKLSDCLILTQIPKGVILCTFDAKLVKQYKVNSVLPHQLLKEGNHGSV